MASPSTWISCSLPLSPDLLPLLPMSAKGWSIDHPFYIIAASPRQAGIRQTLQQAAGWHPLKALIGTTLALGEQCSALRGQSDVKDKGCMGLYPNGLLVSAIWWLPAKHNELTVNKRLQ